jgi:hypothetical protein
MQGREYVNGHGRQDNCPDRAAGQRSVDCSYPEFGPVELVEEINCNAFLCFLLVPLARLLYVLIILFQLQKKS